MLRLQPLVNLLPGFVFRQPIPLLQLTGKLISLPSDVIQVIIGKLSPFLLNRASQLFPLAFNLIPVHTYFSFRNL
jgi:hypothetical protein